MVNSIVSGQHMIFIGHGLFLFDRNFNRKTSENPILKPNP